MQSKGHEKANRRKDGKTSSMIGSILTSPAPKEHLKACQNGENNLKVITGAQTTYNAKELECDYLDTELCNQHINMSSYDNADLHSFRLKLSEQHYYPHNLDCLLQIQAQKDSENIMFYFKLFDIRPDIPPEYCNYDWLQLHDGNSTKSAYICGIDSKLCGISPSRTKNVYYTRGNFLTLYCKSDEEEKYMGFDMVITRYRYGVCRSDEYACDNGRCIDESLQCYGYNPCGDGSDCKRLHPGYIWTAIVGSISLCLLIINIILCVTVFKMRRQKDKSAEKGPLTDTKAKGRSHRLTSLSSNIAEHTVPKMTKKRSNFDDSGVLCDSNTVPKRQIESSM